MIYSGRKATSGIAAITAIPAPAANVNNFFRTGVLWNSNGSPAGQWSVDGGGNWIDFDAGPFSMPLPSGIYAQGVKIRRAQGSDSGASESDVTSVQVILYE